MDLELIFSKYINLGLNTGPCLIRRGKPKYNEFDGNCYAKYYRPCGE